MAAEAAPAPAPRKAEKSPPVLRRESEAVPKKRVGEMAPVGGSQVARVAKAPPRASKAREEEEEDATVSKHASKPTKITKAAPARPTVKTAPAKAASKPPKKMTVPSPEPEDSGSDFE